MHAARDQPGKGGGARQANNQSHLNEDHPLPNHLPQEVPMLSSKSSAYPEFVGTLSNGVGDDPIQAYRRQEQGK